MAVSHDTILTEWNFKTGSSAKNIDEVVRSIKKAERQTKKYELVQKSLGTTTSRFSTIVSGFKGALTNVASGFNVYGMAIGGAISITKEFWNESTQLAGALGDYTGDLEAAVTATDNFAKALDIANARNRLNAQDMAVSDKQWTSMLANLKRLSQTMGIDVKQAIDSAQKAMGEGRYRIAAKIGVVYDIDKAYATYAATLGKTVSELTELEEKRANQIAFLDQLKVKADELGPTSSNLSEHMTSFWNTLSNSATIELAKFNSTAGEAITKLLNMGKETNYAAEGMSTAAVELKKVNDALAAGDRGLKQYKETMAEEDFGSEKYKNAVNNYNRLLAVMDQGYEKQRRLKEQVEKENSAQKTLNKTLKEQQELRISLMLGFEDKSQKSFLTPGAKAEPNKGKKDNQIALLKKAHDRKIALLKKAQENEIRKLRAQIYMKQQQPEKLATIGLKGAFAEDAADQLASASWGTNQLEAIQTQSTASQEALLKLQNAAEQVGSSLRTVDSASIAQIKSNENVINGLITNAETRLAKLKQSIGSLDSEIGNLSDDKTIQLGNVGGNFADKLFSGDKDIELKKQKLDLMKKEQAGLSGIIEKLGAYKKTNADAMGDVVSWSSVAGDTASQAFSGIAGGIWQAADAAIQGGDSMALAMQKMLKQTMLSIASQASVKAVFELAEYFATWPVGQQHLVAAGIYGSVAVMAGGAGIGLSYGIKAQEKEKEKEIEKKQTRERSSFGTKRTVDSPPIYIDVYLDSQKSPAEMLIKTLEVSHKIARAS